MKTDYMKNFFRKLIESRLSISLLLIAPMSAYSAAADPDTTFGSNGVASTSIANDAVFAVAIQPDGKIVAVGQSRDNSATTPADVMALVRFNADGSLDTGFNSTGKVTSTIDVAGDTTARAAVIQTDGKILVAGYGDDGTLDDDFFLARFNADGSNDTGFGSNGLVVVPVGTGGNFVDRAHAMALQADGKILIAGQSSLSGFQFTVIRFNTDGSLDTTFDVDGIASAVVGNTGTDIAYSVIVQPDEKILLGGYSNDFSKTSFALVRLNSDGSMDTSFDTDGAVVTPVGSGEDYAYAMALQPDGKILLAGRSETGAGTQNHDFAVVRYNSDGSLDTSFDGDGIAITSINATGQEEVWDMVVQADGKVLLAGTTRNGSDSDYAMIRYNSDGSLDTSFDGDGKWSLDSGSPFDRVEAIAMQSDGRILLAQALGINVGRYLNDADGNVGMVTPAVFDFVDDVDVATDTVQTSANVTISGLGTNVSVPVTVTDGEFAINAGAYTATTAYIKNGDQISVRHTSANTEDATMETMLIVGGVMAGNNAALILGGASVSYASTTSDGTTVDTGTVVDKNEDTDTDSESGGGGALSWLVLFFGFLLSAGRRMS